MFTGLGLFLLGYVFGSIPNGLWLVKAIYHMDIRDYGSGNIGATNVFRTVGPLPGLCVLVLDILKGVLPLIITEHLLTISGVAAGAANVASSMGMNGGAGAPLSFSTTINITTFHILMVITAIGALLGHNYSLFLHFKGGRGVATGLGLFAYLLPMGALAGLIVWLIVVGITRYVSLGSIIGALCAAIVGIFWGYPLPYAAFGVIAAFFVIIKHKDNIKRLRAGTESKIKAGKAPKK
jgi:glycerol-3-phosphate acyltransferase PlsY